MEKIKRGNRKRVVSETSPKKMCNTLVERERTSYGSVDHHGRNPYEGVAQ